MSIGASQEQEMLKDSARRFFQQECEEAYVREMEGHETGWTPAFWEKMTDLGWHALMVPEAHGGAGLGLAELGVVLEEAGRALAPGPFLQTQIAVSLLNRAGSDAQKAKFLPGIADGSAVHTVAVTDRQGRWGGTNISLTAETAGDSVTLTGNKRFVPYAIGADVIWIIARSGSDLVAVPVPGDASGLTIRTMHSIAQDHQADLDLNGVRVDKADVVTLDSYDQLAVPAILMECAWLLGLSAVDFEITLDYTKERHAFGKPIGAFQAIQHRAADIATDLETMRAIVEQATLAYVNGDESATLMASIAKAWSSDASRRIVAEGQQLHGGIGFTMEYRIQLYFKRQKHGELFWGDADFHREVVKEALAI